MPAAVSRLGASGAGTRVSWRPRSDTKTADTGTDTDTETEDTDTDTDTDTNAETADSQE